MIYIGGMVCERYTNGDVGKPRALLNTDRITFSAVSNCQQTGFIAPTYGIKYVLEGTEHYVLNRRIPVSAGNFLLVNKEQPIDFFVGSRKPVLGFCIHIRPEVLEGIYTSLTRTPENLLEEPFVTVSPPQFGDLLYSDRDSTLGHYLKYLSSHLDPATGTVPGDDSSVFFELSKGMLGMANNMPGHSGILRQSTRLELQRRLEMARVALDDSALAPVTMEEIARGAMLSTSHFFRSFKSSYGLSPYQYLLHRRLEHAARLLCDGRQSVTEIAMVCGFADGASFCKQFRKRYHVAPSKYGI